MKIDYTADINCGYQRIYLLSEYFHFLLCFAVASDFLLAHASLAKPRLAMINELRMMLVSLRCS